MRRVVITGMGAVTPLGNDADTTWNNLVAGNSGVGPMDIFDVSGFPVRIAAQVRDFDPARDLPTGTKWRHLSRAGRFGVAAAAQAIADADIADVPSRDMRGVAMGGSVGRPDLRLLVDIGKERADTGNTEAFQRQAPGLTLEGNQNLPTAAMARLLEATGPMVGISTACSGSGHAVGEAYRLIQEGDADLMLAGGYDSLTTWLDVLGFSLLGALTPYYNDEPASASRPFDAQRSGFVLGEGAVVFVLEDRETALRRGARILAEVLGYASTLNAWRITDSPPDGTGAVQVMEGAIAESGVGIDGIDYVAAHGTSTPGNDESETVAIKKVFGDHAQRLLVSSPKSMAGHLTAAGAALNMLAAIGALRHSVVPPTLNLENPGRGLDLDYVPHTARPATVRTALINAFAFGGTNTGLVLGRSA